MAERAPKHIADPPLHQVVRAIVDHVAALAQALEIALSVVARVVIEVCRGQNHTGVPGLRRFDEIRPARRAAAAIAPGAARVSNQRPPGRQRTVAPCGRPQPWQIPPARSNRTGRLISGQSLGYNSRISGLIGIDAPCGAKRDLSPSG